MSFLAILQPNRKKYCLESSRFWRTVVCQYMSTSTVTRNCHLTEFREIQLIYCAKRMGNSKILLYVHSVYSKQSRWMPWELDYFDGLKGKVGIVPVTTSQEETFKGEEYLNLYPYVDVEKGLRSDVDYLWISESSRQICSP